MSTIDIEALLAEVSADDPCGPDLEYDAEMRELENTSQGKPEQQMGDAIVAAQEPDWRDVRKRTLALLARSKDLRIASLLTRSMLRTSGFEGFADGLAVTRGLVDRYWDGLHPRLDPDDNNDPTMRVNIVMSLCDQNTSLLHVRNTPFVSAPNLGRFGLRELSYASGEAVPPAGQTAPTMATIEAAFMDASLDSVTSTSTALEVCLEHLRELESKLTGYVGSSHAPSLDPLRRLIFAAARLVKEKLTARTSSLDETEALQNQSNEAHSRNGNATGGGSRPVTGDIRSREDVVRVLEKVVEYYQRYEPSSPVPILVRRCTRLVTASFEDIVMNLIPDAATQLAVIKGPADENGN